MVKPVADDDKLTNETVESWRFCRFIFRSYHYGDELRNPSVGNRGFRDYTPKGLLAHWLTYLYNFRVRISGVVEPGIYPAMVAISEKYLKEGLQSIIPLYSARTGRWKIDGIESKGHPDEKKLKLHDYVLDTLATLEKYDRSLVKYLEEKVEDFSKSGGNVDENIIRVLAYSLNDLSYRRQAKRGSDILEDWLKSSNKYQYQGHKRLWAALKDYLVDRRWLELLISECKVNGVLKDFLIRMYSDCKSGAPSGATEKYVEQFELPFDSRNEKVLANMRGFQELVTSARDARRVYNEHVGQLRDRFLFPFYLEATFKLEGFFDFS